jgi:hypothetical protein
MTKSLGQAYSIQTFDQQLYAIAKQVEWAKQDTFKTHILRLGGFHTMSCFVASIGKLWGDSGLKDLLIESSVYAAGSVEQMMTGKQFNSAVRALPLVYEALSSLWLSAFFEWCRENDILTVRKDKLSPVLASPRFFIINYFLFKCFYDLLNPSSAPLEHQTNVSKKDDC